MLKKASKGAFSLIPPPPPPTPPAPPTPPPLLEHSKSGRERKLTNIVIDVICLHNALESLGRHSYTHIILFYQHT